MEIEASSSQVMAKKLSNIVRQVVYLLTKGLTKSTFFLDLHLILKRAKLSLKAFTNLMLHQHFVTTTIGRPNSARASITSPSEFHHVTRTNSLNRSDHTAMMKHLVDMLNSGGVMGCSPSPLPGFGRTPLVRQLRVTDSPFPMEDEGGEGNQVDKAAENFINNFYKELKRQKRIAFIESPSPYH